MKITFGKNRNVKAAQEVAGGMIRNARDFEHFYNTSAEKLFHVALKIVNDKPIAEGIVHDVFSDIWERRKTLSINVPLEAYAVRAVKFTAFDRLKEKIKKEKANKEISTMTVVSGNPIEEEIHARELQGELAHLVSQLPLRCQEVFRLRREKLMSNKDIATGLNISEKTVERHMTRALHFIKIGLK
ncbi:MAG: RNA polymerase sigma-70 factor [Bacteroidota bacterium]